jgi:uroporphyrin-3 C-methyltransferase
MWTPPCAWPCSRRPSPAVPSRWWPTLRQADERLARYNQPRLERVRRAVAQDLDRTRAPVVIDDIGAHHQARRSHPRGRRPAAAGPAERRPKARGARPLPVAAAPASAAASAARPQGWWPGCRPGGRVWRRVWAEVRALVRVTRIDRPEAMLVAPEQAFFLRENLKLRLLNARLALLSRQFDTAQATCATRSRVARPLLRPQFAPRGAAADLVRQVAGQARQVSLPRPDETWRHWRPHRPGRWQPAAGPMRNVIWLVLLFAVAVVAATTLGTTTAWPRSTGMAGGSISR